MKLMKLSDWCGTYKIQILNLKRSHQNRSALAQPLIAVLGSHMPSTSIQDSPSLGFSASGHWPSFPLKHRISLEATRAIIFYPTGQHSVMCLQVMILKSTANDVHWTIICSGSCPTIHWSTLHSSYSPVCSSCLLSPIFQDPCRLDH